MTEAVILDLLRSAIWTALVASAPVIAVVMLVGLVVSLFQALTQVQEVTLTFVPKIVAALVVLVLASPFIGATITGFSDRVFVLIGSENAGASATGGVTPTSQPRQ